MSWTWQKQRVCAPSPWISSVSSGECAPHEARDDHAVLAALPRADGVEQPGDDDIEPRLLVVGEREELVHRLRVGVGPAALRRRAVDAAVVLGERPLLAVVAVDLGRRRDEDALAEGVRVLEHDLGAAEVRDERAHGLLDDQPHADRCREVVDDVAAVDELVHDGRREHRVDDEMEPRPVAEMGDVVERAGGEVVEDPDLVLLVEEELGEVRADESCAAGDEYLHERSRVQGAYGELPHRRRGGRRLGSGQHLSSSAGAKGALR